MISKEILEKLHEINLIVVDIIKKNYKEDIDFTPENFWYEVVVNGDGSLRLGFQSDIINNNSSPTHIQCENNEDFDRVKELLNNRL